MCLTPSSSDSLPGSFDIGKDLSELILRRFFSFALNIMAATIVIIEGWKKASRNILAKWRNARQAPLVVDLQEKRLDSTSGAFDLV